MTKLQKIQRQKELRAFELRINGMMFKDIGKKMKLSTAQAGKLFRRSYMWKFKYHPPESWEMKRAKIENSLRMICEGIKMAGTLALDEMEGK